jgi:hypothetical protein
MKHGIDKENIYSWRPHKKGKQHFETRLQSQTTNFRKLQYPYNAIHLKLITQKM